LAHTARAKVTYKSREFDRGLVSAAACVVSCLLSTGARADLDPAFTGKLDVDTGYVTGALAPTDIAFSGDGRAVVTQKGGDILVRHPGGSLATVPYPFGDALDTESEKGLLGVVADPDVVHNRRFYFYVSNGPTDGDKHRVYRAVLAAASDAFTVTATPIIGASRGLGPGLEGPENHDGGGLFIAGGSLYVSVGDTGQDASPPVNKYGNCLNKGNGKILRVSLDGTIPIDNPLTGVTSASGCDTPLGPWTMAAPDRRVFAWGFRNPWRFWVDQQTGLLWVGDVGESTQEEISVGPGGRDYGFPFVEGNMLWGNVDGMNCTTLTPSLSCTPPAFAYGRAEGVTVTGGLIPAGCGWLNVFGGTSYVFGDSGFSWLRALPVNAARTGFASQAAVTVATFDSAPVSIRQGPDAAIYVVYYGSGTVMRFAPTSHIGADCGATSVPARNRWSTGMLALALAGLGGTLARLSRERRAPPP
jgi:glucose/arabinose dehydrogenase